MKFIVLLTAAAALAGCATPNTGIVPIGKDTYMASRMGGIADWSGGSLKVELYKEAAAFCSKAGKQVVPGPSTSHDTDMQQHSSAEIQFRCE